MFLSYLLKPCRLDYLHRYLQKNNIHVLDVGCGNHSPSITKKYYPNCIYYGLDFSKDYNLSSKDLESMEKFFEIDLSKTEALNTIPDAMFDCIIFNHVIEHLSNGKDVLVQLIKKLRPGGILYLETPHINSIYFPRMQGHFLGGCLNFYDDKSHMQKPYDEKSLVDLFRKNGCHIVSAGVRHSLKRIIFFPIYLIGSFFKFGYLDGCVFWDILGFVEQIVAIRE